MEFRILGPLDVVDNGRAVNLPGAKHLALLAMLVLHANEVVSTERLIEALWEEEPPQGAQKTLQVYVSQLRKALGKERVQTTPPGYALRIGDDELDLARFQQLAEAGRLREALALWRGPALAEFSYARFAQAEIARLEELRLAGLEQRIEHDLDVGHHVDVVAELGVLVREHPLRERLRAQLMLALYRSGRQAEALAEYRDARRVFVEELGIEPGRALRELEQAILEQDPRLDLASTGDESPGTFVGREAELKALLGGLAGAVAGRGRLVMISGEPGSGKSRLAEELAREAGARGARVLIGRCWEGGGAPAYWPWVQSLREHVRESTPELLRTQLGGGAVELAQILPELRELLPGMPEPPPLDSDRARFRLLCATVGFLRSVCAIRPTVLVLDDLHAADPPSLELLRFVVRELGSMHLLVVGAYRDVDPVPGQPLSNALVEVAREPGTRHLSLGGLSEAEVTRYLQRTAPSIASTQLGRALHEQTEGNPLFVCETVHLLALEGIQPGADGAVGLAIPRNVREVIARRLTHLTEDCNRVLLLAAVLGREFAPDALARLAAVSVDELLDRLDEAIAARVLSDVPGSQGHLRFSHVLIRDTLYDGLATARRIRLHRRAAEALEDLYGDSLEGHEETPQRVLALAHHWARAGEPERAIDYYRRAGELALRVFANYEAAQALTRGVELLRQMPASARRDEQELGLTVMLGAARGWGSPDYSRARDLSVKLGRDVGPPILRGMAMNSILQLDFAGAWDSGIALLAAGERDDDPVAVVEGEYVLGVTAFWRGRFGESRRHLQAAIDRYSPAHCETHLTVYQQDPKVVCLSRLAWTLCFLGRPEAAAEARDGAVALADELDHAFSRCYASLYGAIVSEELDDERERARLLEVAQTLATATDRRFELLGRWAAAFRSASRARRGDAQALIALDASLGSEKTRLAMLNSYFVALLARACLIVGEPSRALGPVTTAQAETHRTGARYMQSELQRLHGELLVAMRAN